MLLHERLVEADFLHDAFPLDGIVDLEHGIVDRLGLGVSQLPGEMAKDGRGGGIGFAGCRDEEQADHQGRRTERGSCALPTRFSSVRHGGTHLAHLTRRLQLFRIAPRDGHQGELDLWLLDLFGEIGQELELVLDGLGVQRERVWGGEHEGLAVVETLVRLVELQRDLDGHERAGGRASVLGGGRLLLVLFLFLFLLVVVGWTDGIGRVDWS